MLKKTYSVSSRELLTDGEVESVVACGFALKHIEQFQQRSWNDTAIFISCVNDSEEI
jgi:hypothetical protein